MQCKFCEVSYFDVVSYVQWWDVCDCKCHCSAAQWRYFSVTCPPGGNKHCETNKVWELELEGWVIFKIHVMNALCWKRGIISTYLSVNILNITASAWVIVSGWMLNWLRRRWFNCNISAASRVGSIIMIKRAFLHCFMLVFNIVRKVRCAQTHQSSWVQGGRLLLPCGGLFSHRDSEGLCEEAGRGRTQTINVILWQHCPN